MALVCGVQMGGNTQWNRMDIWPAPLRPHPNSQKIYRFYIHQLLFDGTLRQICEDCEDCEALRHSANVQLSTPAVLNYPGYVPINQHLLSVYVL